MKDEALKVLNEVDRLLKKGNIKLAYEKIKKLYELHNDNNFIKLEYAKILLKMGLHNATKVRSIFKELLDTEVRVEALLELCYFESNFGKEREARRYIKMLMDTEKKDYALVADASLDIYDENMEIAREKLDTVIVSGSDSHIKIRAALELAKSYIVEKNYLKAKALLEDLSKNVYKNDNRNIGLELGKVEALIGHYDTARVYFNDLITSSNRHYAFLALGDMELECRHFEMARFYYEELQNMHDVLAYDRLGFLEMQLGNYEESKKYYDFLYHSSRKLSNIGFLKLSTVTGDYDAALHYLETMENINVIKNDINKYRFYLLNKLGKKCGNAKGYFYLQADNYDERRTLLQVENSLSIHDKKVEFRNFNDDVDIINLLDKIKLSLPELIKIRNGLFDKYIYKDDEVVSKIYGMDTNYVEVLAFNDTNKIVDFYPVISKVTSFPRKTKKISIID